MVECFEAGKTKSFANQTSLIMLYFVKKPQWVRRFYGDCIWEMNTSEKILYLTFDDGPNPHETSYVLEQLDKYNAKATFFCIGENVSNHSNIFKQVVDAGHSVGNHTHTHIDGWKTRNDRYYKDIATAAEVINSPLFRPPFGHITWNQVRNLKNQYSGFKTVLWNLLSADFDTTITPQKCLENVIDHAKPGSIILFHDSDLASKNMRYALPRVLEHFSNEGYRFEKITP